MSSAIDWNLSDTTPSSMLWLSLALDLTLPTVGRDDYDVLAPLTTICRSTSTIEAVSHKVVPSSSTSVAYIASAVLLYLTRIKQDLFSKIQQKLDKGKRELSKLLCAPDRYLLKRGKTLR